MAQASRGPDKPRPKDRPAQESSRPARSDRPDGPREQAPRSQRPDRPQQGSPRPGNGPQGQPPLRTQASPARPQGDDDQARGEKDGFLDSIIKKLLGLDR